MHSSVLCIAQYYAQHSVVHNSVLCICSTVLCKLWFYRFSDFIGLGVGAGANIMARYAVSWVVYFLFVIEWICTQASNMSSSSEWHNIWHSCRQSVQSVYTGWYSSTSCPAPCLGLISLGWLERSYISINSPVTWPTSNILFYRVTTYVWSDVWSVIFCFGWNVISSSTQVVVASTVRCMSQGMYWCNVSYILDITYSQLQSCLSFSYSMP